MSNLPNSITHMGQSSRNVAGACDSFDMFFECWIVEQNQHLQELVSASKESERQPGPDVDGRVLLPLLERVVHHYEHYYDAKSSWAKNDVLSMFNPSWISSLEDAYLWVGGWRPSMAFHLLYSKCGLQFEARFHDIVRGLGAGYLIDLSSSQLAGVDGLQKNTIKEERRITEKMAKRQETVAGSLMVQVTHSMSELMLEGEPDRLVEEEGRMEAALDAKEEGFVGVLQLADDLRLKTLKKLIDILSPIQGVYFFIAAAELHLRIHEWGRKRDARHS